MLNKIIKFLFYFLLPSTIIAIAMISYISFSKLVSPHNETLSNGKKVSEIAAKVRKEQQKRKDLTFVRFNSKDGIKLSGCLVKREKPTANLLICHGYQMCKEFFNHCIDIFPTFNVLLFDFRAHGQSGGKYRTLGCHEYKDVIAAAQFLNEKTKTNKNLPNNLPLIIWGFSMGGSAALKSLEYEPNIADAFIVDSGFGDLRTVIYHSFTLKSNLPTFPFLPIVEKMTNFFACCNLGTMCPINNVKNTNKPILFIHSCLDEIVPPTNSLQMYASNNKQTKLWIGPNAKHCNLVKKEQKKYRKKMENFLKESINL